MVIRRPPVSGKPKVKPLAIRKGGSGSSASGTTVRRRAAPAGNDGDSTSETAFRRGKEGFRAAEQDQKRKQEESERRKERPFSFRISQDDVRRGKNEVKLLYLDKEPYFVRLHTVKMGTKFDDVVCLADQGINCPLCTRTGREGVYTMLLSAIDRRPYRANDGKMVQQTKRLVPVKGKNIAKYERFFNKHNTFRGMVVTHRRHGDKESAIGEDLEFAPKLQPETVLRKYGDTAKPADYVKGFQPLTYEEMQARYGDYVDDSRGGYSGGGGRTGGNRQSDDGDVSW